MDITFPKSISELTDRFTSFNSMTSFVKYGLVIASMGIFIYVMYLASNDPSAIFTTSYIYTFVLIVPIVFIFFLLNDKVELKTMMNVGILLLVLALISYGYSSKTLGVIFSGYVYYIFVFLIMILTLAIIYNVSINNLQKQQGVTGFITNLIFYIPCLVSDLVQFMINDYKSTSTVVFVLFIMEISVFLLFFYILPYFVNLMKTDGIIIQGDPVYLNRTTVIPVDTIQPLSLVNIHVNTDDNSTEDNDIISNPANIKTDIYNKYNFSGNVRKNFSISLWSYLNPPSLSRIAPNSTGKKPSDDKDKYYIYGANIFYYGTPSSLDLDPINYTNNAPPFLDLSGGSYHPRLAYCVDLSDSYYVIDTNTDDGGNSRFELRLPMQKWNNFVFNYNATTIDVFINGTLERTFNYNTVPNFQYNTDIMVIGSNPVTYTSNDPYSKLAVFQSSNTSFMGLYGSVCNVVYYPTVLDQGQIVTNYNLLSLQNPPIPI